VFSLRNKSVLVTYDPKLVKQPKESAPEKAKVLQPSTVELITERSKEVLKFVAITAVGAYAAVKTIDTLSQIAVKKTKSADNEK
jgi:hypothetical protein